MCWTPFVAVWFYGGTYVWRHYCKPVTWVVAIWPNAQRWIDLVEQWWQWMTWVAPTMLWLMRVQTSAKASCTCSADLPICDLAQHPPSRAGIVDEVFNRLVPFGGKQYWPMFCICAQSQARRSLRYVSQASCNS